MLQVFFGLFTTYILVNNFDASEYGLYKYMLSFSATFILFAMLGFNFSNIRFIPEYLSRGEYGKINGQLLIFSVIHVIVLFISILVMLLLYENGLIKINNQINITCLFLIIIFNFFKYFFSESILCSFSKRLMLTYFRIGIYVIQFGIVMYAVLMRDVNFEKYVFYYTLSAAIEFLILFSGVLFVYPSVVREKCVTNINSKMVYRHAWNNYGFTIVNYLRDNAVTIILVSYLFGFTEVSYYSMALIIPNVIRTFTPSKVFSGFIVPQYVRKYNKTGDDNIIFDGLNLLSKINVIYLVPAIIYSIFMYKTVIGLAFGDIYVENSYVLSLFIFGNVFFLSFFDVNLLLLNIIKRSDLVFKLNLLSAINIFIILTYHEYGQFVIGIGNLTSTFLTVLSFWIVINKIYKKRIEFNFIDIKVFLYVVFLLSISLMLNDINKIIYSIIFLPLSLYAAVLLMKSTFLNDQEYSVVVKIIPKKLRALI